MDPLNDKYPLKLTSEDEGRFVLLPLAAYPSLVEDKRDGHEHVGWALVITKVDKKQAWLCKRRGRAQLGSPSSSCATWCSSQRDVGVVRSGAGLSVG